MTSEILTVKNGSGWNKYAALSDFPGDAAGRIAQFAKGNVASIVIEPADREKPFGIAARFFCYSGIGPKGRPVNPELKLSVRFDGDSTAEWIIGRISAICAEGVEDYMARRASERRKARLEEARKLGFKTLAAYEKSLHDKSLLVASVEHDRKERLSEERKIPSRAADATRLLVEMIGRHPEATSLSRAGKLLLGETAVSTDALEREYLYAWLVQNGYEATVDHRNALWVEAKRAIAMENAAAAAFESDPFPAANEPYRYLLADGTIHVAWDHDAAQSAFRDGPDAFTRHSNFTTAWRKGVSLGVIWRKK